MQIQDVKLAIVGLGYVGLPLAVEFGKHRSVLGFDINTARINELKGGHDHTLEVDDAELATAKNLRFTDQRSDLTQANVFIVTVPTPIDEYKQPDLTPLVKASETIGQALKYSMDKKEHLSTKVQFQHVYGGSQIIQDMIIYSKDLRREVFLTNKLKRVL